MFQFRLVIIGVMILLLMQPSFAAFLPMNCDDHNPSRINAHAVLPDMTTHHQHESVAASSDKTSPAHHECETCGSSDCRCCDLGRCLGSSLSPTSQAVEQNHVLFIDHGNRFNSPDEYPDAGIHLLPYRPPIFS